MKEVGVTIDGDNKVIIEHLSRFYYHLYFV